MFSSFFKSKPKNIHPLLRANHDFFSSFDQDMPIQDYEFVVFDTELTGLDPKKDEIISIGAVRIKNLQIIASDSFHSHIRPNIIEPRQSTLIHRITPEQLRKAPQRIEILAGFIEFCSTALLVGHYVDLDIAFTNKFFKNIFHSTLHNPCLDTMRLARIYKNMCWKNYYDRYDLQVSYNLTDLAAFYNIPSFEKHDAFQDAMQTAYLFLFLVKQLQRQGLRTLKDFFNAGKSWRQIF